MIFGFLYQSISSYPFDFRDENQDVIINCSSGLSDAVIPRTVKEIYSKGYSIYAFKNCKETIKSIRFEDNNQIISISSYSFSQTKIESADLSNCNHLTLLNSYIFQNCYFLNTVLLPQNILSI